MKKGKVKINNIEYLGACVYIAKNINNGKIYIGSTKTYRKRMNEHRNDLIKCIHVNKHLQRSFNEGNIFTFEILEISSIGDLLLKEDYYCEVYKSYNRDLGYNILKPGECPKFTMTKEHKIKMQEGRKRRGYDCSHLRSPEVVKRGAEGKYKKVNIFLKDGTFYKTAKSLIEAEDITKVRRQNIGKSCRGDYNRIYKGYYFRFYNDSDNFKLIYNYKVEIGETVYESNNLLNISRKIDMTKYEIHKFSKIGSWNGKVFKYTRKN